MPAHERAAPVGDHTEGRDARDAVVEQQDPGRETAGHEPRLDPPREGVADREDLDVRTWCAVATRSQREVQAGRQLRAQGVRGPCHPWSWTYQDVAARPQEAAAEGLVRAEQLQRRLHEGQPAHLRVRGDARGEEPDALCAQHAHVAPPRLARLARQERLGDGPEVGRASGLHAVGDRLDEVRERRGRGVGRVQGVQDRPGDACARLERRELVEPFRGADGDRGAVDQCPGRDERRRAPDEQVRLLAHGDGLHELVAVGEPDRHPELPGDREHGARRDACVPGAQHDVADAVRTHRLERGSQLRLGGGPCGPGVVVRGVRAVGAEHEGERAGTRVVRRGDCGRDLGHHGADRVRAHRGGRHLEVAEEQRRDAGDELGVHEHAEPCSDVGWHTSPGGPVREQSSGMHRDPRRREDARERQAGPRVRRLHEQLERGVAERPPVA